MSAPATTAPRSSPSSPAGRSSSAPRSGTATRSSCSGPGCRRTSSSPRSSSACSPAAVFGLAFWQAALAILLGTGLGSFTHGVLSARGPEYGVPQMVLSRISLRLLGQRAAGRAERGHRRHRLVRGQQRQRRARAEHADQPAAMAVPAHHRRRPARDRLLRPQPGAGVRAVRRSRCSHHLRDRLRDDLRQGRLQRRPAAAAIPGGFLLIVGATFGYAAGWNPYAADYTRYLPATTSKKRTGSYAGLGVFVSCLVLEWPVRRRRAS